MLKEFPDFGQKLCVLPACFFAFQRRTDEIIERRLKIMQDISSVFQKMHGFPLYVTKRLQPQSIFPQAVRNTRYGIITNFRGVYLVYNAFVKQEPFRLEKVQFSDKFYSKYSVF